MVRNLTYEGGSDPACRSDLCIAAGPRMRKCEIRGLSEAMAELKLTEGTVVTRGEEKMISVAAGQIIVLPAWRFLLNLSDTA